jgi:hypothetical protein
MPSKYSHTVVLAQHSSRGLINLPNDQYIDYLRSSPLLTTKPPPQRPSTAPPKNRSRATSTQTNESERLAVHNSLRQHTSSDQLAAGAYRHQASHGRLYRPTRCAIVDSEEDDSGEYSDVESHSSRPSYVAYSKTLDKTNLRQKRLLCTLPIELHQQLMHEGLLSANSHNSQGVQKKLPQPALYAEPDVRQSMELPIQIPTYSSVLPARGRISAARVHHRDFSNPKSLTTPPQLSRTSTQMTHRDDSPATPFSSLQRATTPVMTDEQTPDLSREDPALSQNTRNHTPEPMKMPLQANFDDFLDGSEQDLGYFKDLPESAEARKARLVNMRAYNAMEKAIKDSPTRGACGSEKNLPAVPDSDSALHPPAQNLYRSHLGSLSSLSSLSDFAIDAPIGSQTMGHRNTSAAAIKTAPPSAVCELEAYTPQKQARVSSSAKQIQLPPSRLPSQSRNKLSEFDPNPLDPTTISFSQFINSLEFRFSEPEPTSEAAATPPDIARHPPAMLDPLAHLIVDSTGGVTNLAAQEQLQQQEKRRQRAKTGIFSSLRLKGKNRRAELM